MAVLLLLLLPAIRLQARGKSEVWAETQYSTAERMRQALNDLEARDRTRRAYQRVIAAYRRVYYGAPASAKADPSVMAVADLLADMGRCLHNDKALRSAVGEYKFLRREYPGSRNRFAALFAIARIYQDDLKETAQAKPVFEEFLRRYPRHSLAEQARHALAAPLQASLSSAGEAEDGEQSDQPKPEASKPGARNAPAGAQPSAANASIPEAGPKPSRVTNIRYWSSPDYTRVAVDLEGEPKFEAQRIEHPQRIFFDLADTGLAPSLARVFSVDDGLLSKIRVAQFQPSKTRIVLEVADRSDFDTFMLTNPPRLIIDLHGKNASGKESRNRKRAAGDRAGPEVASLREPVKPGPRQEKTTGEKAAGGESAASAPDLASDSVVHATTVRGTTGPALRPSSAPAATPKKTIVEADDNDDSNPVTAAKLDPPQVKPPTTASALPSAVPRRPGTARSKRAPAVPDVREATPTARGDRSLIRALGLKIGKIVIDPGHGGHDTGTIGPNGLEEKDLVLDVSRRLGKLLRIRLGADVVFTRNDDTFIPLETRTSIANQEQADLFVSIHANSSSDPDARGVETYYLNFTSSAEALEVAARENAASDKSIHELQDLVKKIALKEKIEESREFAANVQHALHSGLAAKSPGIRDRGVKKAPFIVLIGANMPSILAEISFVSNPGDERRMTTIEYRQRIAESLYRGISKYVSGLSGVKVASKMDKSEAP